MPQIYPHLNTLNRVFYHGIYGNSWSGAVNNPSTNQVLCDSTALTGTASAYLLTLNTWADTPSDYLVQMRDAANATTLWEVRRTIIIVAPPSGSNHGTDDFVGGSKDLLPIGGRFRVLCAAGFTGNCELLLKWEEVGDTP